MEYSPILSVLIISYNQEKYIAKALESVLLQKVNFQYKIVIADDCSKDKTLDIIRKYSDKFPEVFDVLAREINVGVALNAIENYQRCTTEYVALLEGDDYWLDEYKLQKQFDFMEAHPEVAFCYTNSYLFHDGNEEKKEIMVINKPGQNIFDLDYYFNGGWFIMPTLTLFIRKNVFPDPIPDWIYSTFNLDWALNILYLEKGKAGYIDEITAMYRKHTSGITYSTPLPYIIHNSLQLAKNLDKHFNFKYHHIFVKKQWRYHNLVLYYFEKKKYFKGFYWLLFSFFRNPVKFILDIYFLKTLFKVIFHGHEV